MNIEKISNEKLLEDYYIDESRFLLAIAEGETFITAHRTASSCQKGGTIYYKQELSYRFDIEFIRSNYLKLIKLGILTKKKPGK